MISTGFDEQNPYEANKFRIHSANPGKHGRNRNKIDTFSATKNQLSPFSVN